MTVRDDTEARKHAISYALEQARSMDVYRLGSDAWGRAEAALAILLRERDEARKALKFYAERRNYRPPSGRMREQDVPLGGWMEESDSFDGNGAGARARAVLAAVPASEEPQG